MGIYIGFLGFIFIWAFACQAGKISEKSKKALFLNGVFLVMYLLYSLRASSVGRDLPGYERVYNMTGGVSFGDFGYVYFENGYILLMKVCHALGMSFQAFMAFVNAIILIPVYLFIKKYSTSPLLSVLIYTCYMFFEFNMTGIRQAIAASIVLLGIMALLSLKKQPLLAYLVIVFVATFFHRGAFIGFLYLPFHFMKSMKTYTLSAIGLLAVALLGRGYLMSFIKNYFDKESMNASAGLYIGLNVVFLLGLAALFTFGAYQRECAMKKASADTDLEKYDIEKTPIFEKMFLLSIVTVFLFGSDNAVRSFMLFNQVFIVLLPNCIKRVFDKKTYTLAMMAMIAFFTVFFFTNTLLENSFDIVPYKFFWET